MKYATLLLTTTLLLTPIFVFGAPASTDLIYLVNESRRSNNLPPLVPNPNLDRAAELKVENLTSRGVIEHTWSESGIPWWPLRSANYNYEGVGENLAVGLESSEVIVESWLKSPQHRANILNPNYTELGIAVREAKFVNEVEPYVVLFTASPKQEQEGLVLGAQTTAEEQQIALLQQLIAILSQYILQLQSI